jgi:hypothetical protein
MGDALGGRPPLTESGKQKREVSVQSVYNLTGARVISQMPERMHSYRQSDRGIEAFVLLLQ